MKRYVLYSTVLIAAILTLLCRDVLSQKTSGKIDAFHESLKQETAQNLHKAIQPLEGILKDQKDDYLVNLRLGWLWYNSKNYEQSKSYYAQANTIAGNRSIEALLGLTLPLSAQNDWNGVASAYRTILTIDPLNYTANLRLGQILLNKGSYADARVYLERVFTLYPGSYEPNLSLGWTYYYLGDRAKATALLTTALMLSPGDTLAQKGLNLLK